MTQQKYFVCKLKYHLVPLVTVSLLALSQTILDLSSFEHRNVHGSILVLADSLKTSELTVANNINIRIIVDEFKFFGHYDFVVIA